MTPTFRLDIRIRNNRIIRARERLGYDTQAAAERGLGLSRGVLCGYESFRESPLSNDGVWTSTALRVADALMSDPEDLWPKDALAVRKARMTVEATSEQMRELLPSADRRLLVQADAAQLKAAMSGLTSREEKILRERFVDEREVSEIAADMGLSMARVRQIVTKCTNKVRSNILSARREEERQRPISK